MPRDRHLRSASWPLRGATGERWRCWTPRCRSPVAKRTPDAGPLRGLASGGSGPDAPDRVSGRARSGHQSSRATITPRMAEGTKPYRLYRGGRKKGKVPLQRQARPTTQPTRAPGAPKRRRWWLWGVLALVGLLVLAVLWGVLGFRSFSSGVAEADARLPRTAKTRLA